jgi:hypothetical protein
LSYRIAYTSVRAVNSAPKNATFTSSGDRWCTTPGDASKKAACAGPGGTACREVSPQQLQQPRILRPQPRQLSLNHRRDLSHEDTVSMRDLLASKPWAEYCRPGTRTGTPDPGW